MNSFIDLLHRGCGCVVALVLVFRYARDWRKPNVGMLRRAMTHVGRDGTDGFGALMVGDSHQGEDHKAAEKFDGTLEFKYAKAFFGPFEQADARVEGAGVAAAAAAAGMAGMAGMAAPHVVLL